MWYPCGVHVVSMWCPCGLIHPCVCGIGRRGILKVWGDDIAPPRVRKAFEVKRLPRRAASHCTPGRRRLPSPLPLHRLLDARVSRRRPGVLAWTQVHEILAGQPVERGGPKRKRGGDYAYALDGQPGERAFLVFRRDRTAVSLEGIPYRELPRPRAGDWSVQVTLCGSWGATEISKW